MEIILLIHYAQFGSLTTPPETRNLTFVIEIILLIFYAYFGRQDKHPYKKDSIDSLTSYIT